MAMQQISSMKFNNNDRWIMSQIGYNERKIIFFPFMYILLCIIALIYIKFLLCSIFFIINNMHKYLPSIVILFALIALSRSQCVEYKATRCIRCSQNQVLINNNCINKINGCIEYLNEKACARCNSILFRLSGTKCILSANTANFNTNKIDMMIGDVVSSKLTLHQLAAFGDYQQIPFSKLNFNIGFMECDKFLRAGQYKHFISRSPQPVQFVAVRSLQNWKNYQIIYEASGGGLLMCLVNYQESSKAIAIRSIVSIGTAQLVDHCLSYSSSLQCNLYSGKCNKNIQGCVSYYQSICLACQGFLLLVENHCISDCGSFCDTNKIVFFQSKFS